METCTVRTTKVPLRTSVCKFNGRVLHDTNSPALEYTNGDKEFRVNNRLHRTDGPAVVKDRIGKKYWYVNGHRVNSAEEYKTAAGLTDEQLANTIKKFGQIL